ncbi:ROK family protein [Microlunatus capsulatus]|uniref:ROK family protein n=1 Tax=Microlunatus capsulatus TaxID=99117 RepID=UPI0031E34223
MPAAPTPTPAPTAPAADRPVGVVDVGGSHVTAALAVGTGPFRLQDRRTSALDPAAPREELLDALAAAAAPLAASSWTVALPGPFDYARGRGDFADVAKFASLAGVDLRAALAGRLGVAGAEVRFVNDAVAYGLGEWSDRGAPAGRFVCLTLGTGVGSAWLADGEPVEDGPDVPPHGWAHLLTVDGGPLEDTVSTRALVAAHRRRTGVSTDVRGIAEAVRAGDADARATWDPTFHALGRAVGPSLQRFGTTRLVVGGAIARSFDLLEGPLAAGIADRGAGVPPLSAATLQEDAPLVGAAVWRARQDG